MQIETVTVTGPDGGPLIVNRDQWEADQERWGPLRIDDAVPPPADDKPKGKSKSKAKSAEPQPPVSTVPQNATVSQDGDRWYIVDGDGNRVDGFDVNGYDTDVAAWTVLTERVGK